MGKWLGTPLVILLVLWGFFQMWRHYRKEALTRAQATKEVTKHLATVAICSLVIVVFFVCLGLLFR
jgi:uncharacterized membrane protein YidH (DUF202 family)